MDLSIFLSLILSYHFRFQPMRRISTRSHLSHTFHIFTNTCLPHVKPYVIKPNFIFDSSFLCCAWLWPHTCASHMLCFSSILPPPCSCLMFFYLKMPFVDSISRSDTNMYIQYDTVAQKTVPMFACFALNSILCDRTLTSSKSMSI